MMTKPTQNLEWLSEIVFGLARNASLSKTATITIELDRRAAEGLLFKISAELEQFMVAHHRTAPIISLGRTFQYRGVNFRFIEAVE